MSDGLAGVDAVQQLGSVADSADWPHQPRASTSVTANRHHHQRFQRSRRTALALTLPRCSHGGTRSLYVLSALSLQGFLLLSAPARFQNNQVYG